MNAIYLCGGTRFQCFKELVESGVVNLLGVINGQSKYNNSAVVEEFRKLCLKHDIPFHNIDKSLLEDTIAHLNYDLLISVGYRFIIPNHLIEKAKYAVNVHPTLLPKYRGYRSGPYIIINGETKTGVSVHVIDEGMDTGDIILQKEVPLNEFDTVKSMSRKTAEAEGQALIEAITQIQNGTAQFKKQNESEATVYNYIRTPKDSEVDWEKPLKELYNSIRACDPIDYPAFFYVNGEKVFIKLWREEENKGEYEI